MLFLSINSNYPKNIEIIIFYFCHFIPTIILDVILIYLIIVSSVLHHEHLIIEKIRNLLVQILTLYEWLNNLLSYHVLTLCNIICWRRIDPYPSCWHWLYCIQMNPWIWFCTFSSFLEILRVNFFPILLSFR